MPRYTAETLIPVSTHSTANQRECYEIFVIGEIDDWVVEVSLRDHLQYTYYFAVGDFTLEEVLTEVKTDFPDLKEG